MKWEVGDGKSINLREDHWLMSGKIGGPVNQYNPKLVADIIDPNVHAWNTQLLNDLFDNNILEEIQATPVSILPRPD